MAQWHLTISDETDRSIRKYLTRSGASEDGLSEFVDRAVRQAVFWETVKGIKEQNKHLDQEELQALIDEAVDAVRAPSS